MDKRAIEVKSKSFLLYVYIDTYAALLYKTGKYNKALIQAKKAIVEAKKVAADYSETEKLLEKIKRKL